MRRSGAVWKTIGPSLALALAVAAWLWPIGLGGTMPVGGDVTQFQIGLMAVLSRALRAGRLPLWNDLWGYGFPGVAESQMGVFYPPYVLLFGYLAIERAIAISLVVHTFWGALGAAWAARRFGASAWGGLLAGFAWAASGFFVIHLPHQWGYTSGSWMPWAWGLAWPLARGEGTRRGALGLAAVLALQLLPGHFQLAFITQVGVGVMALWALVERPAGGRAAATGALVLLAAGLGAALLAAAQLGPTYRLARLAESRRDFEYLSGFAATPLHLVSYVAPGLFHRSPLWRPVVWDPFHTSPEEHLAYLGLAPLFLALGAMVRGFRRDPAVRFLTVLALVTLVLSLGPYVPGFRLLIRLPGFSFFRAPARWGLATELALAILAGKGLAGLPSWPRPGRMLVRFGALAVIAPLLVILGFELALISTERPGWPSVVRAFDRAARLLPWTDDPSFREVLAQARAPQGDLRVRSALARSGRGPGPASGLRLDRERFRIYADEWGETGLLLLGLLALAPFARRPRLAQAALVLLTAADLWTLSRDRPTDLGPIRPLTDQSPILARLAAEPRGTRTVDGLGNLPMLAGAAPVSHYRTLDLPALPSLTLLALQPPTDSRIESTVTSALRAAGASYRILNPFEPRSAQSAVETIADPALAGWLFGADLVRELGPRSTQFALWQPRPSATRAWLIALPPGSAVPRGDDPMAVLALLARATPLRSRSPVPERLEIDVPAAGPSWVILSQLADPEWRAHWSSPAGDRPALIRPIFTGWQAVRVPTSGTWTLQLDYPARDVYVGLIVSALAWALWTLSFLWPGKKISTTEETEDTEGRDFTAENAEIAERKTENSERKER